MSIRSMAAQMIALGLIDLLGPRPETRFTAGRRRNKPKSTGPTSKRAKAKAARKQRQRT